MVVVGMPWRTVGNLQVARASVKRVFAAAALTGSEICSTGQVEALHDLLHVVMDVAMSVGEARKAK